jgi:NADH-quinone oxidoreductase subunit L
MRGEVGFERFFSYMNLFVASMLLLVLGDNLTLLYLGWEGVGVCSYLLIGFYYVIKPMAKLRLKPLP